MFLNVGCSNEQNQSSKIVNSNESKMDIKYKIVFLDKYIKDYINKFEDGTINNKELFQETVFTPILQEYSVNFKNLLPKTVEDIDGLKEELSCLTKERDNIEKIIKDTLNKCNGLLHTNEDLSIYVLLEDPNVFKRFNVPVRALTPTSGTMLLILNPIATDFTTFLPYTVGHEYHHSVAMHNIEKMTLVTQLMSEGKAETFAHILFPDVKSKLSDKLNENEEYKVWNEIKDNISSEDVNLISKILNGGKDEVSLFGGYRLGYEIVQEFVNKNPNVNVNEWTSMKAEDILEKSGYPKKWN